MKRSHSMPFGAEVLADAGVRFRLWAPKAAQVKLCIENGVDAQFALTRLDEGWFELTTRQVTAGARYRFQIDEGIKVPDPASRFQPEDVHGPSEVVDPAAFEWTDAKWRGRAWEEAAIYELHVGTFAAEGTFQGVERKLDYLRDLGVTAIELMPVSDFPGSCNWGYDGVLPYAPDSIYGRPEDLKRLVQSAHAKGLMIILDVVYNHFGPDGNYLHLFSPQFFSDRHSTPWGDAINFDGPESRVVRDFFIHNALYWLEEYHFDGLRLDAVHAIVDDSTPNILTELAQRIRGRFGSERYVHLILENGDNEVGYLRRDADGAVQLYDAQWNDDIHHAVHVVVTRESDGYYSDYAANPMTHLCRCLREGFAYQGEYSEYHREKRGKPSEDLPATAFISFLQNHDQVGNRAFGERILRLASPQAVKAVIEILLLSPAPPMLFMGEEFGATTPFLYFCDFHGDLATAVTSGRRNEFARFEEFNSPAARNLIPDPNARETYLRSKLDWGSLTEAVHADWLKVYRELLALRQTVVVAHLGQRSDSRCRDLGDKNEGLFIEWRFVDGARLELRANLSGDSLSTDAVSSGPTFYASSPQVASSARHGVLPPWSVVWSIHS